MRTALTRLELLAPARDADVARQAILHGADAVYIGGPSHGARAAAANSIADIAAVADFAHRFDAKVYVTFNTIIYDAELARAAKAVGELYRIGVDALIVQDMGLLRLDIPPIALHASTQCDIRTPEKALFLARCGFSQLVLPREFSLQEIEATRAALPADVAIEAFVHGALCVSYSGDCQASFVANGRSANRGECAQMCRMAYDLLDQDGRVLARDKHLLSLRDLCRLSDIPALASAGVSSFKIEGRLKDAAYVKNVVGAYRRAIDEFIADHPLQYCRSSLGESRLGFEPDVAKAFNRGFTSYFLRQPAKMACHDTPKWVGEEIGTVRRCSPACVEASLKVPVNNGDGIGFFDKEGKFCGFRVNRAEGGRLFTASPVKVPVGATLYRNSDVRRDAVLARDTAVRLIPVDMTLRQAAGMLALRIEGAGACAEAAMEIAADVARSPQLQARAKTLAKLGDTIYELRSLADLVDPLSFIPLSQLAVLRRQAVEAFDRVRRAAYKYDYRRPEDISASLPATELTYHDNIANAKAEQFYRDHGAAATPRALEAGGSQKGPLTVMTTRYCLRRELGACLRTPQGANLPSPLYIQNRAARYRLDFDCAQCRMKVVRC